MPKNAGQYPQFHWWRTDQLTNQLPLTKARERLYKHRPTPQAPPSWIPILTKSFRCKTYNCPNHPAWTVSGNLDVSGAFQLRTSGASGGGREGKRREREGGTSPTSHAFLCRGDEEFVFFFPSFLSFLPSFPPRPCLLVYWFICSCKTFKRRECRETFHAEKKNPRSVVFMG